MTSRNTFEYKKRRYRPNFLDGIYKVSKDYNELDQYDTRAFDELLAAEYKKKGLDIALNINSLSKRLKLSNEEINGYLMWLYKKESIVLYSNGYGNSFYDKEKNTDKNIENIYLIRLKKGFIDKINTSLKIIDKNEKYKITYNDKKRHLYVNNLFISRFTFDKTNDRLMSFLIKNPNKKFTKTELQQKIAKMYRL